MRDRAENVSDLVDAFGGTCELADWLDVVPSTVSNWKDQNAIPTGWHLRLYLECQRRGISFSPHIFRLKETGAPPLKKKAEARHVRAAG